MEPKVELDEASNPETPFQRLLQLTQSEDVEVRRALVDNPSIAVDESGKVTNKILLWLVHEFPDEVARSLAFALFGLELKDYAMVAIAQRIALKSTDPQVITIILQEFRPDDWVRRYAAGNSNSAEESLRILGNVKTESDALTRVYVSQNSNAPDYILRILVGVDSEPEKFVRDSAKKSMKKRGLL